MAFRDTSTLFRIQGQGFDKPLPMKILNIEDKSRSSLLSWRGQFSPQLIEALLSAYCPENSVVLDPFSGSGTVLYEAAHFGNAACGVELNPSAWILSRIYQLMNYDVQRRDMLLRGVKESIISRFPEPELLYSSNDAIDVEQFREDVQFIGDRLSEDERIIFDVFVILLDIANNRVTLKHIHDTFYRIRALLQRLPFCSKSVIAFLADARS
ncbi:MAG: DNA methyltransferase, partial [Roseiflexaceae bacterium]